MAKLFLQIMAIMIAMTCHAAGTPVYKTRTGIIISRADGQVRALEPFTGTPTGGTWYAEAVNMYRDTLPQDIRIYNMIVPTSAGLYCPDEARAWIREQKPVIDNIYSHLADGVESIDIYSILESHKDEPVFLRTDHHWAPLGAYYAAQEFAKAANVHVPDLKDFDRRVVQNFVGSMYRFSRDIRVKNSPEEFVYYTPKDSSYTTTYIGHNMGRNRVVTGITEPFEGRFFVEYKDGSSGAYCTFMSGDTRTTHVQTGAETERRLLIVKDSYGNAIPGYLFGSFSDIYVVDFRYFTRNIVAYINENHITDVLLVNNLQHAYNRSTGKALTAMLYK